MILEGTQRVQRLVRAPQGKDCHDLAGALEECVSFYIPRPKYAIQNMQWEPEPDRELLWERPNHRPVRSAASLVGMRY